VDFHKTVDRGSAVNFDADFLDVCISGPKRNLDHKSLFSRGRFANEFIQILFSNEAHLTCLAFCAGLLLELY